MNDLHLTTTPTADPRVFDTYWMTGLIQKGRVRVTVPRLDDARTAAELAAAQYLLTVKNVCGHNKAGAGLRIYTSSGTIPELMAGISPKSYLVPYANFLRTRFLGAEVQHCESPYTWADELCESQVDFLDVPKPSVTVLDVSGVGPVELTAHAVEQYVVRFDRKPEKAWRELARIARDVQPAVLLNRNVMNDIKHRRPGRYVLDEKRSVLLVIAEPDRIGRLPRLVTVVHPESNARVVATNALAAASA